LRTDIFVLLICFITIGVAAADIYPDSMYSTNHNLNLLEVIVKEFREVTFPAFKRI
jgi:hypothetical protein